MTDDDNIIMMPKARAERLRKALDAWRSASDVWADRTVELALELKAARDDCGGDDRRFGIWLAEHNCDDLGRDARADLIHMGEHIELTRDVLRLTHRKSIELIWEREIKPIVDRRHLSERSDRSAKIHEFRKPEQTTPLDPQNSEPSAQKEPQDRGPVKLSQKSGIHGRPHVEKISEIFLTKKTRGTLGHMTGPTWKLLLQAYDAGLLPTPTETTIKQQTARFFFPYGSGHYLNGFDLTNRSARSEVVDLLAQMIAHKDELLAEPERVELILTNKQQARKAEQKAAVIQERAVKALAALPPDESEVIMFGKRMWPIIEGETIGAYDFRTLQVAVWKFTDLNRWMHRDSPRTRGINIRNSTKWDRHFIGELTKGTDFAVKIDRIYSLVHALCSLMEQHPDGECKEPMTPLVLG